MITPRIRPTVEQLVASAETLAYDMEFRAVQEWKAAAPDRKAVGFMPIYVPRELIHAAGMLSVGVVGGGDKLEIIRGDAYFQSYICHIPRSTIELGVSGRLDCLDGMMFPSICDVIRNLSGMWKLLFPKKYVKYVDVPQNYDPEVGGRFYRHELETILSDMETLSGRKIGKRELNGAIADFNRNRSLLRALYQRRSDAPWEVPTVEAYVLLRAGYVLPVDEHNAMLSAYLEQVDALNRREMDNSRVVIRGAFCEQPPLGLIRTIERSGCYIVDDDFLLGARFITADVAENTDDPVGALVDGYLRHAAATASKYEPVAEKGSDLVNACREHRAEGVIFCAASFCDPALLDQPMLQTALQRAGIQFTSFKFAEDTGQFAVIREQAGTFADSIKLWSGV